MIPGARFAHLTGASLAAALAQADSAERDTLRKLAELRAAFEGQEHPKFEAVTVAAPMCDEDALAACRFCTAGEGEPCDGDCPRDAHVLACLRLAAPEVCNEEEGPDAA